LETEALLAELKAVAGSKKKTLPFGAAGGFLFFFPLVNSLLGELLCFMLMKQLCIDHSML
jgi:hypothetical protein